MTGTGTMLLAGSNTEEETEQWEGGDEGVRGEQMSESSGGSK